MGAGLPIIHPREAPADKRLRVLGILNGTAELVVTVQVAVGVVEKVREVLQPVIMVQVPGQVERAYQTAAMVGLEGQVVKGMGATEIPLAVEAVVDIGLDPEPGLAEQVQPGKSR